MSNSPRQTPQPDPLGLLGRVGPLCVIWLACVVLLALGSDLVGWTPLDSRLGSAILASVAGSLTVAWLVTGGRAGSDTSSLSGKQRWLAGAPALMLLLYAAAALFLPQPSRVEWFLNGDHVRHLVLVADIQAHGALSYEIRPYPRAWHTSVALFSSLAGRGGSDLVGLIDLMATLTWLLSALLALTTSALAVTLSARLGLQRLTTVLVGAVAGAATLWPAFLGNYQALGLEASLVAAVVLAVSLREILMRPDSASTFLVCAAGLVVMGHTWQLLLPVSGIAAVVAGLAFVRPWSVARAAAVGGVAAVVLLATLPAFTAVATSVGVAHAAVADIVAPVPVATLVAGLLSATLVMWVNRRDARLVVVLLLIVLPVVTSVVLAARVGVPVTSYYPGKLLWHSATLGLTAIGAVAAYAWVFVGRSVPVVKVPMRAALGTAGVLCTLGAIYAPWPAFTGAWSTADGATVLSLLRAPGAEQASVVWSDGRLNTDAITRISLDAYKPEQTRVDTAQRRLTLDEECRVLEAASEPVILSNLRSTEVRARYACVPEARIISP